MKHRLRGAIKVVGKTDVGQIREHNEDFIDHVDDLGLIILADGMGGARAGEVASELAVKTMLTDVVETIQNSDGTLEDLDPDGGYTRASRILGEALANANKTVFQVAQSQPQYKGMGTTVVGVLFYDNALSISYVGDSRLYRFRGDSLGQITEDHTMIQELVKRGFYTPEQAKSAANKNVLTRAVGVADEVEVDLLEEPASVGDIYLFCSDGLSDMVEDEQIQDIMVTHQQNLENAVEALVLAANENGGKDNVSVILAQVQKAYPAKRGWRQRLIDWMF